MRFPLNIPDGAEFDVLGFGTNAVDFLITVPNYPDFGSKVELENYIRSAGGEVATTMVGLQRLGMRTSYAGRFGDDDAGRFGWKSLLDEGVDLDLSKVISGAETQIAFIVIDETSGERTVIWKRDKQLAFGLDEIPVSAIENCRLVHMTPHDTLACIRLAEVARNSGVPVSVDIDTIFDGIEKLLPLVDILIMGSEFPKRFLGVGDINQALQILDSRFENALLGVTLGADGSVLLCGGEFIETPGFAVPNGCKDTTGAGDAFRAGLLYGLLQGEIIEVAARMANAVAALKCRKLGARTALPTRVELATFLTRGLLQGPANFSGPGR
jgi:sugar/nucleoside kinase (ribokinase family)